MKKFIVTIIIIFTQNINAQVAIGKDQITNTSVSLEFGSESRGVILPYNINKTTINTDGTIIYDTTDHKVKYLKNGNWSNLSEDDATPSTIGIANLSIQGNDKTEQITAKTVIGGNGAAEVTPGILVLSDDNKAMILPKVASPHLNIVNPAAGMVVYDTTKRQLAVYNGTVWTFWKP